MRAKANCISQTLRNAGIEDMETLQNAPRILGGHVCGEDIYQIVAELNRLSTLPEEKPVEKKTRKRKPKQVKEPVEETEIMEDNE